MRGWSAIAIAIDTVPLKKLALESHWKLVSFDFIVVD